MGTVPALVPTAAPVAVEDAAALASLGVPAALALIESVLLDTIACCGNRCDTCSGWSGGLYDELKKSVLKKSVVLPAWGASLCGG